MVAVLEDNELRSTGTRLFFAVSVNFFFKLRIVLGIDQAEVEHQLVELLRPYRCGMELATVSPG